MSQIIYYSIPFFFLTMAVEYLAGRRSPRRGRGYEPRDTRASLAMGVGNLVFTAGMKTLLLASYVALSRFALFEIEPGAWAWLLVFFGEDLCYYAFHRAHHEARFLWAAHVNHHSSRHYNLSTALRQSWTTPFTGPIFWVPLVLIGIPPWMIAVQQAISLLYQYWLHTELIGRLGPFEWIFNTPSHHRVHHGRNAQYLDRNYGGILILWDRLFGTFEPEREEVDYGLTRNLESFNPFEIAFHEWKAMLRDFWAAPGWREGLAVLLRRPGWKVDGSGATAVELRAAWKAAQSA